MSHQQLTLDALKALRNLALPGQERLYFVHIDDLLPILRATRQLGYRVMRTRKNGKRLSIWEVWTDDYSPRRVTELYVDRTRTMERGKIIGVDKTALKPKWSLSFD